MMPKVSIQIPTYNQAGIIHKAIDSCLAQDYPNLEVVVIDDCSTDNTEAVVQKYKSDQRFRYFRNNSNLGRVKNYKHALHNCVTGDWVINLDGDDYLTNKSFVSNVVELINKHKTEKIVLVMNQNMYLSKIPSEIHEHKNFRYCIKNGMDYLKDYRKYPFFLHLASVFHRATALSKNFYDFDSLNADFISLMQLADSGNFIITDMKSGYWNLNNDSATKTLDVEKKNIALRGVEHLCAHLTATKEEKEKIKRELFFVNNYYYSLDLKCSRLKRVANLLKYPGLEPYYIKGLIKASFL